MPGRNGGRLVIGGRKGGRPPDEFKKLCQELASGAATLAAVRKILKNPDHPAFQGALRWATENGYGRAPQAVDMTSGGQPVRFTLALGTIGADDGDG